MTVVQGIACLCLLATLPVSYGFIFGKKTDCLVSSWSEWGAPFGFGAVSRERKILRYPTKGGDACPTDLTETKVTNAKPTLKATAAAVASHFVRRKGTLKNGQMVGQKRDLLIIVDSSGSIGASAFTTAKTQLARLLGLLCPTSDPFERGYQHAALIEYSTTVTDVFDFNAKSNTFQVQSAINAMPYMGQGTCTATAFQQGINMFSTSRGMRTASDVKQDVLLLTDGLSNCGGNAVTAAQALQEKADVYGLMIGSHTDAGKQKLLSYVSSPIDEHLFAVDNYQVLNNLLDLIEAQLNLPGAEPCAPFDI